VYSKVYTMTPSGARGEKRASQEAWPKGLGHWDTRSIGRKRPLVAASAFISPSPRPLSSPPKPIPPGMWCEVARGAVCQSRSPSANGNCVACKHCRRIGAGEIDGPVRATPFPRSACRTPRMVAPSPANARSSRYRSLPLAISQHVSPHRDGAHAQADLDCCRVCFRPPWRGFKSKGFRPPYFFRSFFKASFPTNA
jgi:hypothetical protein